jgi:thiol-disulfide isomerase/thioredoxin
MIQSARVFGAAVAVSLLHLTACAGPSGPASEATQPVEGSRVAAVFVHADWCPSCRALDPKLEKVIASDDWQGVTFIRIDFTGRDREAVFSEADKLGIGEAIRSYFSNGIRTGLLLIVDIDHQGVVDVIRHNETEVAIAGRIRDAQSGV